MEQGQTPQPPHAGPDPTGAYFDACRGRIDGFVARHLTWPGTLRLHGAALGLDILRAPLNVALSPVLLLTRIAAALCATMGGRRAADWLRGRSILLRTAVAARTEALVVTDLLHLPLPAGASPRDADTLRRAVLAAPQFRQAIRARASVAQAQAMGARVALALRDYAGTRTAVADMTTSLLVLAVGGLVFHALTPGMVSMAPGIAGSVARRRAVADFPLGDTLGGVWYGAFPVGASHGLVLVIIAGLIMAGSVVAAFAGILADPAQAWLGIHRRRLRRLIDTLESEVSGTGDRPFAAREHFYARALDIGDIAASVLRLFRG